MTTENLEAAALHLYHVERLLRAGQQDPSTSKVIKAAMALQLSVYELINAHQAAC